MSPFLEKVAEYIYHKHRQNISGLSIVLPNKRAGLFLKKQLAVKFGQTIWSPKIYSIDEFMVELSGSVVAEPMVLLFDLYDCYKKNEGDAAQKPGEFFRWANILINDFNEIDGYCADSGKLFNYLNEIRAIELWNPSARELSGFQKQYLDFWKSLEKLYNDFSVSLRQKKQVYQGLAYRQAVENTCGLPGQLKKIPGPVIFIGFNALTKAEEIVIRHFVLHEKAEILWDADRYYLDNKNQEAGRFLRKNLLLFAPETSANNPTGTEAPDPFHWKFDILGKEKKEIEIIGVSGNITQAKVAGDILASLSGSRDASSKNTDFLNTAVILSDETLLVPVLNSLPPEVKNVNITMGYPLKSTPFHDFWAAALHLHENIKISAGKQLFYHKNVVRLLSHPFLNFSGDLSEIFSHLLSEIKQKNRIYITREELEEMAESSGKKEVFSQITPLFSDWKNNPSVAIETAIYFIRFRIEQKNIEAEFLARYLGIFYQVQSLLKKYKLIDDLRSLRLIFNQAAGSYTIPFSGEPLTGLQIMGMLETRTLDFETVILLAANEDILPSGKKQNSFIPLDIKKQFGLPVYSDRDSIFAYHFYRLIQRAGKVFLLYNNDISNSFGGGSHEKSRFITQIQNELIKINPGIKITEKIHAFPPVQKNEIHLKISKNEAVIKRLDELAGKGFSPTAINTFLNCPLDFYFKYIIGLREQEEVEEIIEAASFGDFVHKALQDIYLPFTGKIVSAEDIMRRKKDSEDIVRNAFLCEYSENDISFGKNLLTLKVAEKLVRSFLNREIEFLQMLEFKGETLTLLDLEKDMETSILINNKTVKLRGKADRIDKIGQTVRIIDYKTGNVQTTDLRIESAEITAFEKPKPKALQLLMYAMICSRQKNFLQAFAKEDSETAAPGIIPGIISLKKLSKEFMPLIIAEKTGADTNSLQVFEKEAEKIISGMYDSSFVFEHSSGSKYCEFCRV